MVKSKKMQKGMADAVSKKKGGGVTKLNPFSIRTVKSKHQTVLGRQKVKVGNPGIARERSIQIRNQTLLQEFKIKDKSNLFLDKRIGEKNASLSNEDKMIARYTSEKLRNLGRNSIFNLGEGETLTHRGKSIDKIEKFDKPDSENEDDDELLNAKYVSEAHFGGFMDKKDADFKAGKGNSRKEFIDTLIKESKTRKAEKRKLDVAMEEKTEALDQGWKELFKGHINTSGMVADKEEREREVAAQSAYDPYDMLVRQLGFERKEARGSERLKTADEVIKEEKEKLDQLEADRLRRMRGERPEQDNGRRPGLNIEDMSEIRKKSKKPERKDLDELLKDAAAAKLADIDADSSVGDGASVGEDEQEGEDAKEDESEEEESDEEESENENEDEDNYSDLDEADQEPEMDQNEKDRYDAVTKEMIAKAKSEIPYSFSVPESHADFTEIVRGRSAVEICLIIDRIIKCNHPTLAEANKEKLSSFFALLLQFIDDCATAFDEEGEGEYNLENIGLKAIEALMPNIFKMTALFPAHAAKCVQEVIKEKFDNFTSGARRKHLPGLDTLIFIRLALLLFPGSDFRHTVITPALILSLQILATARPTDRPTFASGIFLATMVAEACQLSHRFTPELINFLTGIFHVSCDSMPAGKYPPPPCKGGKLLVTTQKLAGDIEVSKLKLSEVTSVKGIDDMFRTQCLNSACILTIKLLDLYGSLASIHEIFAPVITTLKCINRDINARPCY